MVLIDCFSSDVYVCHRESRIFQGPHFVKRLVFLQWNPHFPYVSPWAIIFVFMLNMLIIIGVKRWWWNGWYFFQWYSFFLPSIYAMVKTLAIGYIVMNLKEDGHPHVYGVNIPIITMPILWDGWPYPTMFWPQHIEKPQIYRNVGNLGKHDV